MGLNESGIGSCCRIEFIVILLGFDAVGANDLLGRSVAFT